MTITLDNLGGTAATRRPGDFRRRGADGPPYVAKLGGGVVKSGDRKGLPVLDLYGRPSAFGEQVEDQYGLLRWKEQRLVMGMALDGERQWDDVVTLEVDSPEWKKAADRIVARAYEHAKAMEAAQRGTHTHGTTEDNDSDRDWIKRAEAGEDLGIPRDVQASMVAAWQAMLDATGMEVLAVEMPVVCDRWRLAGTLDRIVRLKRDETFVTCNGEVIAIPAETVIVLDLKTGKLRRDKDGHVERWHSYAVQIAAYAQSVPYDTERECRLPWGTVPQPDPNWAIIAHLPVEEALAGKAVCRLIAVDLNAGEHAGELCRQAKEWESRRDVFAIVPHLEFFAPIADATQRTTDVDPFADLPTAGDKPFDAKPERRTLPTRIRPVIVQDDDTLNGGEGPWATTQEVDDARNALRSLTGQPYERLNALYAAAAHAHPDKAGVSLKVPSWRRVLIANALVELAKAFPDHLDDETLRCVGVVIPDAQQPAVALHDAYVALTCREAETLRDVARLIALGQASLDLSDGRIAWSVPDLVANPVA